MSIMDTARRRQAAGAVNAAPSQNVVSGRPNDYDASVFYQVAKGAGLPTDHGTLNKIVRLVNKGYSPESAAAVIKNGAAT